MNINKITTLAKDIGNLQCDVAAYKAAIKSASDGSYEATECTLIYEQEVARDDFITVYSLSNAIESFKYALDNPDYAEGLLVKRSLIIMTDFEDCQIELLEEVEPQSWSDYDDKVTYLKVMCEVRKSEVALKDDVVKWKDEVLRLEGVIADKKTELSLEVEA